MIQNLPVKVTFHLHFSNPIILLQESSLYDAVQEIDYLDKVVLETLRLHKPAPRYIAWNINNWTVQCSKIFWKNNVMYM